MYYATSDLAQTMLITALALMASALLVYAAIHDIAARTVPNSLSALILIIGVCLRLADHSLFTGAIVCVATFLVLFVIWMLGAMGGGDVKLWAASALLIPPLLQPELAFILRVVLAGGALAVLYIILCRVVPRPRAARGGGILRRILRAEAWRIGRGAPLPYACAIAGGAIATFLPLSLQR